MIIQYFILGESFQLHLNCLWCFVHMATTLCSIEHKINTTLRNAAFVKGSTKDGK